MGAEFRLRDPRDKDFFLAGILLAVSVLTQVVYTAGSGRYIPTGSVLGFQGVSFFFITGLGGYLVAGLLLVSAIRKWKTITLALEGSLVRFTSKGVFTRQEHSLAREEISIVYENTAPSLGGLLGWIGGFGWAAVLFQFAIPFLAVGGVGILTGGVVLLFMSVLLACVLANLCYSRGDLLVFTKSGLLRIPLGRLMRARARQSRADVLRSFLAALEIPLVPPLERESPGSVKCPVKFIPWGALAAAIGNLFLLATGNQWAVLNQVFTWTVAWLATAVIVYGKWTRAFPRVLGVSPRGVTGFQLSRTGSPLLRAPALFLLGILGFLTGILLGGITVLGSWGWPKTILRSISIALGTGYAIHVASREGPRISAGLKIGTPVLITPWFVRVPQGITEGTHSRFLAPLKQLWHSRSRLLLAILFLGSMLVGLGYGTL